VVTLAVVVSLVSGAARAQPTANDAAAAEILFEEGRRLMAEGHLAAACAKLSESNRLDTGIGTLLYLAECYEKSGQTASAWATFKEAAAIAQSKSDPREAVARTRAAALEPRLSKLVVSVPPGNQPSGLVVKRDGTLLGQTQWDLEVPVDPGRHTVSASAPGKQPWEGVADVAPDGARVRVEVPPLRDLATAGATADPHARERGGSAQRVVGLSIAGLGLAGVVVGAVFGLSAKSKADEANAYCDGPACDAPGLPLRDDARTAASISTVSFVVGGIALAAGGLVFFTAPRSQSRVSLGGSCGDAGCGATVGARF
jgi:serine/threonine-protein kinase